MTFKPETKEFFRKQGLSFSKRLLSTKLMFLAVVWVAAFYSYNSGKMQDQTYRDITLGICAMVLGASWIDRKTEPKELFDGNSKPGN